MIIAKRLKGKAISAWLGSPGDAVRKAVADVKSRITPAPRRLDVYFDITDPWSYLTGQAVQRLLEAYPVDLELHIITPPASDVDPEPVLRRAFALRDTQALAAYWDVDFPGKKETDAGMVRDIGAVLIRKRPAREQLACALEVTHAQWTVDKKKLVTLMGKWGSESYGQVLPVLNTAYTNLRKAGHYQGAMIQFDGIWYWGLDRLAYLEEALAKAFDRPIAHVVKPRPEAERGPQKLSDKPLACEMWFSYRSPYSYLAIMQIEDVLAPYGVPLVLKQIAPMVARGIPLPNVKKMYILADAKREADRARIPFGEICDPFGVGIDNCLAIQAWANARSVADGMAFAKSVMTGIWSEARDVAEYVDLKYCVERAQLPWEEANAALSSPTGVTIAQQNAAELNGAGLWGVPAFKLGDLVTWGQDRLPLIADRLRQHSLASATDGPTGDGATA